MDTTLLNVGLAFLGVFVGLLALMGFGVAFYLLAFGASCVMEEVDREIGGQR